MSDWIERLKQQEEATRRERERNQETENRKARIVSVKARPLWDTVIAQLKLDVAELRNIFSGDPSKDLQFLEHEDGFVVVRNGFPHVTLYARWIEELTGVGIDLETQRSEYATKDKKKNEIKFKWASEDSVSMTFDERVHMMAGSLSEELLRKLIEFR